ncbi:MAG: protein-disulfide reductase DsbD family protein [Endozoicomonas sp.]
MPQRFLYRNFLWLTFLCLSLVSPSTYALTTEWLSTPQQPDAEVRLLVTGETDPDNNTVFAALEVRLTNDWKTYWRSPGEGGIAPVIQWDASENLEEVTWHWPVPERFDLLGINTLGYKTDIVFPLILKVTDLNRPVNLNGQLRLSTCTTICVLTDYDLRLSFTPSQLKADAEAAYLLDKAFSRVPVLMPDTGLKTTDVYWDKASNEVVINAISENGWNRPDVILDGLEDITFSLPRIQVRDNQLQARMQASSWLGEFALSGQTAFVTLLNGANREMASEQSVDIIQGTPQALVPQAPTAFLLMIAFALLGGLILNLMPCVLPVLGLKLSSLVQASGQDYSVTRRQFLSSAAGIVASFWLLAGFIWLLKLTGSSIGWGIQFQSPWFIGFMVLVTALFGANLLDLFEVRLPSFLSTKAAHAGDNSVAGHFIQGMFATLLATPCSAPFLGTAVAFALSRDSLSLFSIFTALGVGMSAPYLIVAVRPSLMAWLPKPGQWMVYLRRILAVLLLLTTLWLVSLLNAHLPTVWVLLIAMAPALLMIWRLMVLMRPAAGKGMLALPAVFLSLALVLVGAWSLGMLRHDGSQSALHWQALDESRIPELVAAGKTVFVDVTADWCVTCQANKVRVLDRDPVNSRLQQAGLVLMKGDWTRASDDISAFLQKNRRFGVPFNIVYGPGVPKGIPLPVLLDHDSVQRALDKASSPPQPKK